MRPALLLLLPLAACGAHSSLGAPDVDAGAEDAASDAAPAERMCLPDCTVGHACCAGGCDGPPVPMPSDCCVCLPGEVSSMECGGECGG